ncbi:hypothetical protein OF83DRAFT_1288185 [Amylostereum chailletii]|nr:hypothetical protein OF83DRAFT_1288185 [Amylostereum chailletii]
MKNIPFFTVLLSTSAVFRTSPPDDPFDPRRFNFNLFDPITETGFDEFASKVDVYDRTWTLSRVASTYHISHLGRSLFPSRYDVSAGNSRTRDDMKGFSCLKLLCGEPTTDKLDANMKLACLAVRLGLDFKTAEWEDRVVERTQVERHMRIYLSVAADFCSLTTVAASEPLLAETASFGMTAPGWNAAAALLSHTHSSRLDPGDRGEVIAALILLLARDRASNAICLDLVPKVGLDDDGFLMHRVITVPEFLAALLKINVLDDMPARYAKTQVDDRDRPLRDTFQEGYIWFNHYVKIHDLNVLSEEYLVRLIVRGAAAICANNQRGADIIIPVLFGTTLHPDSVSAIIVQVKNDASFSTSLKEYLFKAMDPFQLGVFSDTSKNQSKAKPIIRMVFALASSKSGILRPSSEPVPDDFTAYDIWCAGASHKTFVPIYPQETAAYDSLLARLRNPTEAYQPKGSTDTDVGRARAEARRKQHPATGTSIHHFQNYVKLVESGEDKGDA